MEELLRSRMDTLSKDEAGVTQREISRSPAFQITIKARVSKCQQGQTSKYCELVFRPMFKVEEAMPCLKVCKFFFCETMMLVT
jgi:hypothetical protein